MSLIFVITFLVLIIGALLGHRFTKLPKNIWLLLVAQPLNMCTAPMVVLAGSLLATKIAPEPELATLPLTLSIIGTALGVAPASFLMNRIGRRKGTMVGQFIAIVGALIVSYSAVTASFLLLLVGCLLLGLNLAFSAQMRFAAIESVTDQAHRPKAISVLMIGGVFAAIMGPEVAVAASQWIDSPHGFAGSFAALAILIGISALIVSQLAPIEAPERTIEQTLRPTFAIIKQPLFIIAMSAAAIAYGVMSYIMTASPLNMHEVVGHDLTATKQVVQSHIVAMYLPSLFTAAIIVRIGLNKLLWIGWLLYLIVIAIALSGHQLMHYFALMITLGIGWNFLFTAGTLILPQTYLPHERFKAQGINDFGIFLVQALASLFAGAVLFSLGWDKLIYLVMPLLAVLFLVLIWYLKQPDLAKSSNV
jgi:MFS family permease